MIFCMDQNNLRSWFCTVDFPKILVGFYWEKLSDLASLYSFLTRLTNLSNLSLTLFINEMGSCRAYSDLKEEISVGCPECLSMSLV